MSMTTELRAVRHSGWRVVACCVLALCVWFGGLVVGALAFEPTAAVIVIGPRAAIAAAERADVDLLEASGPAVTVAGRREGFVRRLYGAGALLVLPAGAGGCRVVRGVLQDT